MASKRSHYEDVSIRDNSRVHLGDSFNTLEAQNLGGTRIATQTSQQTVHGDLNIYFNEPSPKPGGGARPSRRVSVPFTTVPTYTERPHLSQELGSKLEKAHGRAGLKHFVVVTGLGGTGKTQLVLHYIEDHEEEYDTILWIDVRSEEAARSAYERCCRALGLATEAATSDGLLQDVTAVQAVLSWLRGRGEDEKWLAVVDNADDLSWDVSSIVPKGKAGAVIVTSQDSQASRLLGGRAPTVKVDAMEPEEAVRLVLNYFDEPVSHKDVCWELVEEITGCLDWLALAIDLAGARVQADVENGDDLATALRQYLADYRRSKDELLRDEEFACTSTYKKTVWTAWEISLMSLRKLEDSRPDVFPVQLLRFLTLFDRTSVQNELFRLASLGWEATCKKLSVTAPVWLQCLLATSANGQWEAFHYRANVRTLLRYGLIRSTNRTWDGLTMHGLVQWRIQQREHMEDLWPWFVIFISSASFQHLTDPKTVIFRKHLAVHFPQAKILIDQSPRIVDAERQTWILLQLGQVWEAEGRWMESEQMFAAAVHILSGAVGKGHAETLCAMAHLASTFRNQGLWREAGSLEVEVLNARLELLGTEHPDTLNAMAQAANALHDQGRYTEVIELETKVYEARSRLLGEGHHQTLEAILQLAGTHQYQWRLKEAEKLGVKVIEARSRVLGEEHPSTLTAIGNLAITYRNQGRWMEAEELEVKVMETRTRVLGEEHPSTLTATGNLAATYRNQGRWKEAEQLEVKVKEASSRVLGKEHPSTLSAIANLAATYRNQGRWKEAEELEVKVMEASSRVLGEEHPSTLTAIGNLSATYRNQGRWKEAEELKVKVMEASSRVLGEEHPSTLTATGNLATTYRNQGRWKEAEELEVKVMEASSRVLGEEHPSTLTATGNLATTYRNQGRWKEAEELEVKVMEASPRVLGEEHPSTLTATGNLAATYWNQGRWKEAEELHIKVMEASSRVLGEEHPNTLTAMANLAATYRNQGRWKEAEELKVKVIEASCRVLGEEHPSTLTAIGNLATTYWNQGRPKEAEELYVKVMEARSRVLGEEHPSTLTAVGNLSTTYRNQGRWKEAEELEVKVMEASSRVLGEEHPDTLSAMANLAYTKKGLGKDDIAIQLMKRSATNVRPPLPGIHPCRNTLLELALYPLSMPHLVEHPSLAFLLSFVYKPDCVSGRRSRRWLFHRPNRHRRRSTLLLSTPCRSDMWLE